MVNINRYLALVCFITVLAAALAGCAAVPSATVGDSVYDRIDAWVQSGMSASGIPGLSLAIVKGTDIVYMKGYGNADDAGRAVTPQTPFIIASVSKSITALAVMRLVEAGTVNLDAAVTTYLPQFTTSDISTSGAITVRQLLNQTSGLSTTTGVLLNYGNGGKPLDDLVRGLASAKLASVPGSSFHYSNANYVLLAAIVEHASGQPYGEYVRGHIFEPLGMGNSSVEATDLLKESMAAGHQPWFGFTASMQPTSPVACLNNISTAEDMAHYLTGLLNGGSYGGMSVCSPDSVAEIQKPAATMKTGVSYAMGFEVDTTKPYLVIKHPGDAPGFNANIAMMPEGNWGIVVLQNANWLGMEGETGGIITGIEEILQGRAPAQTFNTGMIRILFNVIYLVTLFFLLRAFFRLGRWRGRIALDGRKRLRRRLIPVLMNNFSVPVGILIFVPMAFSANWSLGLQQAPDFTLMMIAISALLLALGVVKAVVIIRRMASCAKGSTETV